MEHMIYHQIGRDPLFRIWHALDHHLIIYMNSDGGSIVCSEKTYPINRGVLCFIGAGKYHYTMPDDPDTYDRSKVDVPDALISGGEGFLESFSKESFIYAVIPEERQAETEALFAELEHARDDGRYLDAIHQSVALKLLVLIDRYSIESTQPPSGFINKAIEYICDNIFHDLTIDGICAAIHVSKYHFCRTFRATMHMTVMDYILKTRVVMAQGMLRKDAFSVSEVSERCGFSSVSYFCRAFKDETGMTPLQYRKRNQ